MKKIVLLGLLVSIVAMSCFAVSYFYNDTKGAAGKQYVSTMNGTLEIENNRVITTSNFTYRINGGYYRVLGASLAASANALFVAIGSGSSTTASYTPIYDVVIPCEPVGPAIADGLGATQNFQLDYTNVWYEQGLVGATDYRGDTLNIQVRNRVNSSGMDANNVLDQIYLKLEKVLFGYN